VEAFNKTINSAIYRLKYGIGLKTIWTKTLTSLARWLGVPGIVVSIVMDGVGIRDAYHKDQVGLVVARIFSFALGFVAIYFLFSPYVLVGLLVILASIALSALIAYLEDDPYRDWIGKCVFGNGPGKYTDPIQEMKAFQTIGTIG